MKTKVWVIFVVIFLLLTTTRRQVAGAGNDAPTPDFAQIDAYVQAEMQRAAIPGLAYGVVTKDQVVHLKAFGVADPSGRPVTPQTPFVIGSVGKTFTALAITQLEAAGKLEMNAPVRRYIPWFRTADSKDASSDPAGMITLSQLRNHTSGFSRADGNRAIFFDERSSLEDLVRKMEKVHLNRPVGTQEEYSNLNFLVLGLVVQIVSGQPFDAYVQQNILAPLDMRHTYLAEAPAVQDGLAAGYHIWYGFPIPMHAPFPTGAVSQGYVISSAEDMAHYLIPYINQGYYQGISLTGKPALADQADARLWYDIYWQGRYDQGEMTDGQSGGTQNFNAFLQIDISGLAKDYGVVVLLNSRPDYWVDTVTAQSISEGITAQLYGHSAQSPNGLARYEWYGACLLIDLVLVGILAYAVSAGIRLRRWLQTTRRPALRSAQYAGLDLLAGILVFLLPPIVFHFHWTDPFISYVEIGILVLPASLILCAAGLIRLGILIGSGKEANKEVSIAAPSTMRAAFPDPVGADITVKGRLDEGKQ